MNIANKLTLLRIILAPVFFVIYLIPNASPKWTIPVLWAIFIISEITDYFDGLAARKLNQVSDFGKLFDPFADTIVQITCFLCFLIDGIWGGGLLPVILFLIVVYREFGILFIRNLMLKKGITLGASIYGKLKTAAYICAVGAALLAASLERLALYESYLLYVRLGSLAIFIISVIIAVVSFFDYLIKYKKN
ncbi:MAG: CDP-diacylglycerol--glycerol-3-phosphate 3-phosphatidyltransferase [Treponema sp.]|nr:CDP-diacylglycerol--glycerol-3-phosphate 3-phosphatidyltransferase [Treponema sp.]